MNGLSFDWGAISQALVTIVEPWTLLLIFCGVLGGLVLGMIPGLTAAMGVALMIPFTFTMPPQIGMSLLVAVFVGGISGGCLTAILIRMPGTPSSVATVIDGFPMAQKGQAGRAIGNAVVASFFGTTISAIILVFSAPLLATFALKFYFAEYVAVGIFGLTAVAALTGNTVSRGLLSAVLGMLVATIGISEADGLPRFDFGFTQMTGGIRLLPALIGLFAISQIMHEVSRTKKLQITTTAPIDRIFPSLADIRHNLVNYVRSSIIGTVVGVIPAMGGGPAGLISYAQAKSSSKTPDQFGKGSVEGVIAAESANNATIGGALIIMLTLGIPGDPVTAILLGGLMIHGLQPGPQLFMNNPEVIYSTYFSVFFGSLCMMVIMLCASRMLAKVASVPTQILMPVLFVLAAVGTYSLNNRVFDVGVMCAFGVVGYIFDRWRYPLPPFVLGLVLGPIVEINFRKMYSSYGNAWDLVTRPISLSLLILSVLSILFSIWRHRKHHREMSASTWEEETAA